MNKTNVMEVIKDLGIAVITSKMPQEYKDDPKLSEAYMRGMSAMGAAVVVVIMSED